MEESDRMNGATGATQTNGRNVVSGVVRVRTLRA